MLQTLAQHANKVKFLLDDHSTTILSAAAVGGTVATAVLTGRSTIKAVDIIEKKREELEENLKFPEVKLEISKTDKVKWVWRQYLPPVATGVLTIGCIIAANKISSKKIAALTVAAGVSERALTEYKEKVVEKLGVKEDQKIRDAIAEDRVKADPSSKVIVVGTGKVLCYDSLTGRYFESTMEDIKRAENKVNFELINFMECSLSHFYDEIGLPSTTYSDMVGWGNNGPVEVKFSTVFSADDRPCIAIDFNKMPVHDYDRHFD
jgi:hypothetical protein